MRARVRLLLALGLAPLLAVGAGAFNAGTTGGRAISVTVAGDAAAYLAVAANPASPHDCFVTEQTGPGEAGKVKVTLGAIDGTCGAEGDGTGISAGGGDGKNVRYAFHDLLKVTNKGTRTILLWVNSTPDAGASGEQLHVAKADAPGQLSDSDSLYKASDPDSLTLTVGSSGYVGIRVKPGTLTSGSFAGTIDLAARGT